MEARFVRVVLGAFFGLLAGLAMYQSQPDAWGTMNLMGITAFASLGTSLGCLLADNPHHRRR